VYAPSWREARVTEAILSKKAATRIHLKKAPLS
jgi:hypothetical protein